MAGLSALNSEVSLNLEKLEEEDAKVLKAQEFIVQEKEELDKVKKFVVFCHNCLRVGCTMLKGIWSGLTSANRSIM